MRIAGAYAVEGTLAVYCARVHYDVIGLAGRIYYVCDQAGVLCLLAWRETSLAIVVTEPVCSRCTSLEGLGGSKPWQTSMFVLSKLLLLLLLHVHVYSLFETFFSGLRSDRVAWRSRCECRKRLSSVVSRLRIR